MLNFQPGIRENNDEKSEIFFSAKRNNIKLEISHFIVHPNYQNDDKNKFVLYDFALIKLKNKLNLCKFI